MVGRDQGLPYVARGRRKAAKTPNAQRPTSNVQIAEMFHHRWPTKYKSGNKNTQTISTKCQYKPAISTVL
jgi:hypothetical protein